MRFDYAHLIVDPYGDGKEDKSYYRPILDVQLKYNNNKISTEALLDSGADYCVFEMGFGHSIGIDVESVKPEITRGINNKDTRIYFHNVTVYIRGNPIQIRCGFLRNLAVNLLGQDCIFDKYKVVFNHKEKYFELIWNSKRNQMISLYF